MKKFISITLILAIALIFSSCTKEDNSPPLKEWTYIFYNDADFNNAYDPLNDFSSLVSSDENINYIVLRDRNDQPAEYIKIGKNHEIEILKDLGEVNMGSSHPLEELLLYAKENFPAERYMLAFYDHGGGWMGACWDNTDDNDNLTPHEINQAITNTGFIDIILFTAPCIMSSFESAYQLRNSCEYYIGSADLSGYIFWLVMLSDFDSYIKTNASQSTENIANNIISLHHENRNSSYFDQIPGPKITMSSIKSKNLESLSNSFESILSYYLDHTDSFNEITQDRLSLYYYHYCDFRNLLDTLYTYENNSEVKNQILQTLTIYDQTVNYISGEEKQFSRGLNLYYPPNLYGEDLYFLPYSEGLDFNSSHWSTLLENILEPVETKRKAFLPNLLNKSNGLSPLHIEKQ